MLEVLLNNLVDENLPDENGETPLTIASSNGHVKCMALLLDRAADPNLADSDGFTAAHRACQFGHLKCLQLLSKRGADINRTCEGCTSLDWARIFRQTECINFLRASGIATGKKDIYRAMVRMSATVCSCSSYSVSYLLS
jgi:ankyrin repeat protein